MNHLEFAEDLFNLRASASLIYSIGIAEGKPQEEIQSILKPLQDKLKGLIDHNVKHKVADCALTIKRLEHLSEAYQKDIKFLMQKVLDNNHHIEKIKDALVMRMTDENVAELHADGFTISLLMKENKPDLRIF